MKRGMVYLFAAMDWSSRKVLAWCLSNTLTPTFVWRDSRRPSRYIRHAHIFHTDQGSRFTGLAFTSS
jgi:putative transposase